MNTTLEEFRGSIQPYRQVMSRLLIALLAIAAFGLGGLGFVTIGKAMADPLGTLVVLLGEALLFCAAVGGLLATVQSWWGMWKISGFVGKARS